MVSRRFRVLLRGLLAVLVGATLVGAVLPTGAQADPSLTVDQAAQRLAQLQAGAEQAQEQLNRATVDLASGELRLGQLQAAERRSQAAVDALRGSIGAFAAAAYRAGGLDQTVQLLLSDDAGDFLAQASMLEGVSRRQADVLRRAATAQQRLAADRLAVAQQVGRLQQLREQAAHDSATVRASVLQAQALLTSLKAEQRRALEAQQRAAAARAAAQAAAARAEAAARAARAARTAAPTVQPKPVARPKPVPKPKPKPKPKPATGTLGQRAAAYALSKVGYRYVYGGSGPSAFDCSGLTMSAYRSVGISLPHSAAAQAGRGRRVSASQLQVGDLVFYYSPISHVGLYIGGGRIVDAANPRAGVRVTSLYSMPYRGAVRPY